MEYQLHLCPQYVTTHKLLNESSRPLTFEEFYYKCWSHFNVSLDQNILMTLVIKTYTHFSMPEYTHPVLHTSRVLLCHLGISSFCHTLDSYTSYKNKFDFLHLTV